MANGTLRSLNIEEGIYTLRVDAINEQGEVVDRVESPFQRVISGNGTWPSYNSAWIYTVEACRIEVWLWHAICTNI